MTPIDNIVQQEDISKILLSIAELHQNLGLAFKGVKRKQIWPAHRNEVVGALIAIAWFLDKLEGFDGYANAINELSSALSDLDRGSVHAILQPKARKGNRGRPPDNTDLMCARARVAIAIAYMMQATNKEKTKDEIAIEIAMKYQGLASIRKKITSDTSLKDSIVSWYNEFNQGKVKNQEASDLYRTHKHFLAISKRNGGLSSAFLNQTAKEQLRMATEFVPIKKTDSLDQRNFIEVKKVPARSKGALPRSV
jgi:hypothetical protein